MSTSYGREDDNELSGPRTLFHGYTDHILAFLRAGWGTTILESFIFSTDNIWMVVIPAIIAPPVQLNLALTWLLTVAFFDRCYFVNAFALRDSGPANAMTVFDYLGGLNFSKARAESWARAVEYVESLPVDPKMPEGYFFCRIVHCKYSWGGSFVDHVLSWPSTYYGGSSTYSTYSNRNIVHNIFP